MTIVTIVEKRDSSGRVTEVILPRNVLWSYQPQKRGTVRVKEVIIDGDTYKVASINAGQMRMLNENKTLSAMGTNFNVLLFCLQNANPDCGYDIDKIADLDWDVYKQLFQAAAEVSRFEVPTVGVGETKAP